MTWIYLDACVSQRNRFISYSRNKVHISCWYVERGWCFVVTSTWCQRSYFFQWWYEHYVLKVTGYPLALKIKSSCEHAYYNKKSQSHCPRQHILKVHPDEVDYESIIIRSENETPNIWNCSTGRAVRDLQPPPPTAELVPPPDRK